MLIRSIYSKLTSLHSISKLYLSSTNPSSSSSDYDNESILQYADTPSSSNTKKQDANKINIGNIDNFLNNQTSRYNNVNLRASSHSHRINNLNNNKNTNNDIPNGRTNIILQKTAQKEESWGDTAKEVASSLPVSVEYHIKQRELSQERAVVYNSIRNAYKNVAAYGKVGGDQSAALQSLDRAYQYRAVREEEKKAIAEKEAKEALKKKNEEREEYDKKSMFSKIFKL